MMRKYVVIVVLALVIMSGIGVYLVFDPLESSLFPKCPFLLVTGYKCPGCGSQRVLHSLLQGDLIAAFKYNALMVLFLPVMAIYGYAEIVRTKKPRLYRCLCSSRVIWSIFVVVIAWWVLRNMFGW